MISGVATSQKFGNIRLRLIALANAAGRQEEADDARANLKKVRDPYERKACMTPGDQPRSAKAAVGLGLHLQLSGHTHGGQFWPWNLFVRLQQPFTAGRHRLQDLWIYTSRRTGYWGPPKRFGAPSEITCLRMVRGPERF